MNEQRNATRARPDRSPSGPREANDPGSRRHATRSGSGANEPKHGERKDARGFVSRQGGDQTRGEGERPDDDARPARDAGAGRPAEDER